MSKKSNKTFGKLLAEHRKAKNLTLRSLAAKSGFANNTISCWETAWRNLPCGPKAAIRLAEALAIKGDERLNFLYAAAGTTKSALAISDAARYPAALLDAVTRELRASRLILPENILRIELGHRQPRTSRAFDIVVHCKNGASYGIDVKIRQLPAPRRTILHKGHST